MFKNIPKKKLKTLQKLIQKFLFAHYIGGLKINSFRH